MVLKWIKKLFIKMREVKGVNKGKIYEFDGLMNEINYSDKEKKLNNEKVF